MKRSVYPKLPQVKKPICIVGAGGIVSDAHLPAYTRANFNLIGIYDLDHEKSQRLAEKFNISKVCKSLAELVVLAQTEQCVFDIALPASEINETLKEMPDYSGVLIQKPMGENLDQANEILDICNRKNLVAGINFQLRHAPYILTAKEMVNEGTIGELHDVEIRISTYTPWQLWDFLFKLSRVEILYHSIHYIDVIRYFLGDPNKVYAKTIKHPDMAKLASTKTHIMMDYGKWIRANIDTNHGHNFGSDKQESFIKLEGTKGAIKIKMGVLLDYPKGVTDEFEYYSLLDQNPSWKRIPINGTWFPDAFIGPMSGLMDKLANSEFTYVNSVSDALMTMACVEAAYISSEQGGVSLSDITFNR